MSFHPQGKTLYLTVGNDLRHDDAFGPEIGKRLGFLPKRALLINAGVRPENVIDEAIEYKPAKVVVFDAADFEAEPGTIRIIPEEMVPETTLSTHSFPLPVLTGMIASEANSEIIYIGVQATDLSLGEGISQPVNDVINTIVDFLKEESRHA